MLETLQVAAVIRRISNPVLQKDRVCAVRLFAASEVISRHALHRRVLAAP